MAALRCSEGTGRLHGPVTHMCAVEGFSISTRTLGSGRIERLFPSKKNTKLFFFFSKGTTVFYLKPRDGFTEESVVGHKDTG